MSPLKISDMSILKSIILLSIACFIMSCGPDAPNTTANQKAQPQSATPPPPTTQAAAQPKVTPTKPANEYVSSSGNINIVNDETKTIRPKVINKNITSSQLGAAQAPSSAPGKSTMTKTQYTPEQIAKKRAQKDGRVDETAGKTAAERLAETRGKKANKAPAFPKNAPALPNACSLLSEAFIAKVVNVDAAYISVKDGSGKSPTQRSCFFRWEHEGTPNSGVLVQVQTNPVPEDFPEWAKYYVAAKKTDGDKAPDGSATFVYKDFPGVGEDGAYSFGLGRYYWRTADDYLCMVAFNLQANEQQQLTWAKQLAQEVMRNFKK